MERFEIQRKIFTIAATLIILSALSLVIALPIILRDTSPGAMPRQAGIGAAIGILVHLLIYLAILYGIRITKKKHRFNKEINIVPALALLLLGFMIMDGAFAFWDDLRPASIAMFASSGLDFAAMLVCLSALFLLKKKKEK